jgi:hypothetical protein
MPALLAKRKKKKYKFHIIQANLIVFAKGVSKQSWCSTEEIVESIGLPNNYYIQFLCKSSRLGLEKGKDLTENRPPLKRDLGGSLEQSKR